ncbi:MAG: hypothetical protein ACPG08_08440, partial [Flavobacteriales bacterium]
INSFDRSEAEAKLVELGIGAHLLNTKDNTRVLRLFPKIMKNYVNNGTTFKYVDFHSDATTHKEIDDGREESQEELLVMHHLCLDYTAAVCKNNGKISWERLGGLSQKIGAEKPGPDGLAQDIN